MTARNINQSPAVASFKRNRLNPSTSHARPPPSTANKTMPAGLSSTEESFSDETKASTDNLEPIYDTILEEVDYHCSQNPMVKGHNGNGVLENDTDQGNQTNPKEQKNEVYLQNQESHLDEEYQRKEENKKEQENEMKRPKLTEEDKEENVVLRSSGDLLEMVQSELLSESIYSTNKLR